MTEETYEIICTGILMVFSAAAVAVKLTEDFKDTAFINTLKEIVSYILRRK